MQQRSQVKLNDNLCSTKEDRKTKKQIDIFFFFRVGSLFKSLMICELGFVGLHLGGQAE